MIWWPDPTALSPFSPNRAAAAHRCPCHCSSCPYISVYSEHAHAFRVSFYILPSLLSLSWSRCVVVPPMSHSLANVDFAVGHFDNHNSPSHHLQVHSELDRTSRANPSDHNARFPPPRSSDRRAVLHRGGVVTSVKSYV
jgi:hypothetical protein